MFVLFVKATIRLLLRVVVVAVAVIVQRYQPSRKGVIVPVQPAELPVLPVARLKLMNKLEPKPPAPNVSCTQSSVDCLRKIDPV